MVYMKVNVADAKNKLTELLKEVEKGKTVTICRRGKPIADLVRAEKSDKKRPEFDTLRGQGIVIDPDWWKPMSDEEADAFLDGEY
jgi:prevent-host-death family protein